MKNMQEILVFSCRTLYISLYTYHLVLGTLYYPVLNGDSVQRAYQVPVHQTDHLLGVSILHEHVISIRSGIKMITLDRMYEKLYSYTGHLPQNLQRSSEQLLPLLIVFPFIIQLFLKDISKWSILFLVY